MADVRAGDDEGSTLVALPVLVVCLVSLALAVLVPWGDAAASRTTSRTAADAAALAAAHAWDDGLHPLWAPVASGDRTAATHLLALPPHSHALAGVRAAAQQYADANGEDLVSLTVVARPSSAIGFRATTRSRHAVTGTAERTEATSTAEVRLESGLCLAGGNFGLRTATGCLTTLPEPPAPPAPPAADPAAVPAVAVPAPPPGLGDLHLGPLRSTVRLAE